MSVHRRTMRVRDSIALPIERVKQCLAAPGVDEHLREALAAAVGGNAGQAVVETRAVEVLAERLARVHLSWRITDRSRRDLAGEGSIVLFAVQTGSAAVTEVVATLVVDEEVAPETAAATRRFLDELTTRLALDEGTRPVPA